MATQQFLLEVEQEVFQSTLAFDAEKEAMKLRVEGVDYEDLIVAPEEVLMHRSPVINNFVGRILSTEYALLVGDRFLKVVGQFDKRTTTISLISGKRKEVRKGKKLQDRDQYPICLVLPELQIKLSLFLNEEGNEFWLFVNGNSVYALPYMYGK